MIFNFFTPEIKHLNYDLTKLQNMIFSPYIKGSKSGLYISNQKNIRPISPNV